MGKAGEYWTRGVMRALVRFAVACIAGLVLIASSTPAQKVKSLEAESDKVAALKLKVEANAAASQNVAASIRQVTKRREGKLRLEEAEVKDTKDTLENTKIAEKQAREKVKACPPYCEPALAERVAAEGRKRMKKAEEAEVQAQKRLQRSKLQ